MLGMVIYVAGVTGLLVAELKNYSPAKYVFKPLAGLIFLTAGALSAALGGSFAMLIFAGLFLSFIGDCALLKNGTGRVFGLGVTAFLAAHMAYGFAFAYFASLPVYVAAGLFALAGLCALKPYVKRDTGKTQFMDSLVSAYSAVIAVMAGLAIYAGLETGVWTMAIAATLFVISDIFVGRNRFGPSSLKQFWIITPFYFAAQMIFAVIGA